MNLNAFVLDQSPGEVSLRVVGLRRSRLVAHKFKYALSIVDGVDSVDLLGKRVKIKYDDSVTSLLEIKQKIKELSVSAVSAIKVPPMDTELIEIFQLDNYPKTNLAYSLLVLWVSIYGGLSILAINLLLVVGSFPIYRRAAAAIKNEKKLSVDFLDALAHITAQLQQNYPTVAFMSLILSVSDIIREKTAKKAEQTITDLLSFEKDEVWVRRSGKKIKLAVSEVIPGDQVIIHPGEVIPIDGEIIDGASSIDQKSLTGESHPVLKKKGDKIYAGTFVIDGVLEIKAERVGTETSVSKIIQVVTEGAKKSTEIEDYARDFGDKLVLPTLGISGAVAALTGDLSRFTSMVIVDLGTGMRVSAPTAILSYMIASARAGILIKGGKSIETLKKADTIVFDKTGTLTLGDPVINNIIPLNKNISKADIISLSASAENKFNHPVADAIRKMADEMGVKVIESTKAKYDIGHGVECSIKGRAVILGGKKFLIKKRVNFSKDILVKAEKYYSAGFSVLYLAINGELSGLLTYSDILRKESAYVVKELYARGIKKIVMLTGDNQRVAEAIAKEVGIKDFVADALPEEKVEYIKDLQKKGHKVIVVGDGINDSAALTVADVGISVKTGAEIAKASADVILMEENLNKILEVLTFSDNAMKLIEQNKKILYVINSGVFAAAAFGLLSPVLSSALSDGASVISTLNSLKPLSKKRKKSDKNK
ncbi:MAG: heavy metal translocating P-type ATPase [Candidatus Omnitrophica bacterium]|nr:heavy metal translocating P-type ATPase [Candidatus Omnitrophota bacterium]